MTMFTNARYGVAEYGYTELGVLHADIYLNIIPTGTVTLTYNPTASITLTYIPKGSLTVYYNTYGGV